jgi:(p)ppGpp synthase/HD superfamily hydrolase
MQSKRLLHAITFARAHHGTQAHGSLDIMDHLADVTVNVAKHYPGDPEYKLDVLVAATLHDVLEDTDVGIDVVAREFGLDVAHLVNLLTDKPGNNRYERHLRTYWLIRSHPDAVLIKLCDRRHNHARSLEYGEKKYGVMYANEFRYFKMALWLPGEFVELWAELDTQYDALVAKTWADCLINDEV